MRGGESLDKLDEREIAHRLRPDDRRHFDGNGNVIVDHLGLEFVGITRKREPRCKFLGRRRRGIIWN